MSHNQHIAFFGTPEFSVIILDELKRTGIVPTLVVTAPDRPKGRHLVMTPPPVKAWADVNGIPTIQPEKLNESFLTELKHTNWDLFIVAAYGKILKQEALDIPSHGTLNVHPSLLPKYRGSSPIESALLAGNAETGVSIMLLDEQMDHGPVLAQRTINLTEDIGAVELERELAIAGGALLAQTIPDWIAGTIHPHTQDDALATYTHKIKKEDGLIDLSGDPAQNYRKFRAYEGWPRTYFMHDGKRVVIAKAELLNGEFFIHRVIPEGKKEMGYEDFLRGSMN